MAGERIAVKGLSEALANLLKLKEETQRGFARKAVLAGLLVINRAVKGNTYTRVNRRSGFMQKGFGVRVGKEPKGTVLSGVIVQYPQSTAGIEAQGFNRSYRSRARQAARATKKKSAFSYIAFWWRFLEFGTSGRRTVKTTKAARLWKAGRAPNRMTRRSQRGLDRYKAAKSQGDITARNFVRPAASGSAATAIETFKKTLQQQIETEVSNFKK